MKNFIYLVTIVALTSIILAGLYFYQKSQIKDLSSLASLPLGKGVELKFERLFVQPNEDGKFSFIFNASAKNTTNQSANLMPVEPINPCDYDDYHTNTYYYGTAQPTPSPSLSPGRIANTYEECLKTQDYKNFQTQEKQFDAELSKPDKLQLTTADGQKCAQDYNYNYRENSAKQNIASDIFNNYSPNQKITGRLTYTCPSKNGSFTFKYQTQSLNFSL